MSPKGVIMVDIVIPEDKRFTIRDLFYHGSALVLDTENICLKYYRPKCYNSDTYNIEISLYPRYNQ